MAICTQTLTTSTGGTQTTTTDAGSGAFDKFNFQQNVASNPFQTFTLGACVVYAFRGGSATTTDVIQPTWLDAGYALTVTGPNGTKQLPKVTSGNTIGYYASLGSNSSGEQLYLSPGSYTLSGPGGPDVGAFSQNLTVPASLTWTNRDSVSTITRRCFVELAGYTDSQWSPILGGFDRRQSDHVSRDNSQCGLRFHWFLSFGYQEREFPITTLAKRRSLRAVCALSYSITGSEKDGRNFPRNWSRAIRYHSLQKFARSSAHHPILTT